MDAAQTSGTYRPFACGDDCHPVRYATFTIRTWFGRRRWGVTDQHMGRRLSLLHRDPEANHRWLVALQTMELRERGDA